MPNSNRYVLKIIQDKVLGEFLKSTVSLLCRTDIISLFKNPQFNSEPLYNWLWICWY